jgi:hypothetical protein
MRSSRLLSLVAVLALSSVVSAAVLTHDPLKYATGTDVSATFPGVQLRRVVNVPNIWVFAPTYEPALIGRCTSYGACPVLGPLGTIGDNVYNVQQYRNCYNADRLGMTSPDCNRPFAVLEARFSSPVDFVEFELTWLSDYPGMVAYNDAGDEIMACVPTLPLPGCFTARSLTPGHEGFGTVRLAPKASLIDRVVVGGYLGTGRISLMQYTKPSRPALP